MYFNHFPSLNYSDQPNVRRLSWRICLRDPPDHQSPLRSLGPPDERLPKVFESLFLLVHA